MRVFIVILLVVVLLGGIYAFRTGMISVAKSPNKTLIEVDTGRMKENFRETVNNLDDIVAPRPTTLPSNPTTLPSNPTTLPSNPTTLPSNQP